MNRGSWRCMAALGLTYLGGSLLPEGVHAAGINTDVALPVRRGGFVYRTQVRFLRATDDPTALGREIDTYVMPHVLAYGATERTTLFGVLPLLRESVAASGGAREDIAGFGDSTLLLRQTVLARDAVQRTSRLGLLGGLEIPSGKEAFSSHGTDFLLGVVYTLQSRRHELDANLLYKINAEARAVDPGEELRYDVAYELRVSPWDWPVRGAPSQVYAVIELNGLSAEQGVAGNVELPDTGGTVVFLSPGVQWVTRRVIWETSLQLPVVANLRGAQVEPDFIASSGIRVQF